MQASVRRRGQSPYRAYQLINYINALAALLYGMFINNYALQCLGDCPHTVRLHCKCYNC